MASALCPPRGPGTPAARGNLEAADATSPLCCVCIRLGLEGTAPEHLRPERGPLILEFLGRSTGVEPGGARGLLHLLLAPLPGLIEKLPALLFVSLLLRFPFGPERRLLCPYLLEALLEGFVLLLLFPFQSGLHLLDSLSRQRGAPFLAYLRRVPIRARLRSRSSRSRLRDSSVCLRCGSLASASQRFISSRYSFGGGFSAHSCGLQALDSPL